MQVVRLAHDSGLVHPDLNLGNLLVRREEGKCDAYVIDLDKAWFLGGPLPMAKRRAALRRRERSYVKQCHLAGQSPQRSERDRFYKLYSADDSGLSTGLERGRAAGSIQIFLHRLWWLVAR